MVNCNLYVDRLIELATKRCFWLLMFAPALGMALGGRCIELATKRASWPIKFALTLDIALVGRCIELVTKRVSWPIKFAITVGIELVERCIELATKRESCIVEFGPTLGIAHAVLKFKVFCCIRVGNCVCIPTPWTLLMVEYLVFKRGELKLGSGEIDKPLFVIINGLALWFHPILFIVVAWWLGSCINKGLGWSATDFGSVACLFKA